MKKNLLPKERLIFALDVDNTDSALTLVEKLGPHVGCFKVGLQLFIHAGPKIIQAIKNQSDAEIFLDLKLHDIPATVKKAVESAKLHKIRFLTVHTSGGEEMLTQAALAAGKETDILGVTVLTSQNKTDFDPDLGFQKNINIQDIVKARGALAKTAGCRGVVASGREAKLLRQELGDEMIIVTPGVRPKWSTVKNDDQQRIVTPKEAIELGADYIVIGRPIRDAKNPVDAAKKTLDELLAEG